MKRKILATVGLLTCCALVGNVQAADAGKKVDAGTKKLDVKLYGHVNKAIMYANGGEDSDVFFVDGDASSTRFGMKASVKNTSNWAAGIWMEYEYQENASNHLQWEDGERDVDDGLARRHTTVWVKHKDIGKLTLGRTSAATNLITTINLSGTSLANGHARKLTAGGDLTFWNSTTDAYSTRRIDQVFNHIDGAKTNLLRYDSPNLAGFSLAAATGSENYSDIALRYNQKFSGFKVAAGIGYGYDGSANGTHSRVSGSASVLLDFGLSFTLAMGKKELDADNRDDPFFFHTNVGYQFNLLSVGKTYMAIDYGQFDDHAANDLEGTNYGLHLVQKVDSLGIEAYASWDHFELDDNNSGGNNYDDIDVLMSGVRIKF